MVGLTGMAMISGGSLPETRPVRRQVALGAGLTSWPTHRRAASSAPAGYESDGPMHGHGFATLFLAELPGSSSRPDIREKLAKAVNLLVNTRTGARELARIQPERMEGDLSVTISEVMALRAARNAGVYVPKETVERSVDYIKKSQNPDGGFLYMLSERGPSQFPRSAAAVAACSARGSTKGRKSSRGSIIWPSSPPNEAVDTGAKLLSLWSLLCRHGHVAGRRPAMEQVVPAIRTSSLPSKGPMVPGSIRPARPSWTRRWRF